MFLKLKFAPEIIESTFSELVFEMQNIASKLNYSEQGVLRRIMEKPSGSMKVLEIFPSFERETEAHETLRRLRSAQFIRPVNGGRWNKDKFIEIKSFGRIMWEKVGEEKLFARL